MTWHTLSTELVLPSPRSTVFPFFSNARNLQAITPPWVQFEILTPGEVQMRVGALIDYRIRIHGIPIRWQTEITAWDPPYRFIDRQLRGPYRRWIHTHTFEECDGGTRCLDHVEYAVLGGHLAHKLFVRRDVERIFSYRQATLQKLFPATPSPA